MAKYIFLFAFIGLVSSCSFKIPAGTYTTALPPSSGRISFAGTDITLSDNGRFKYRKWSDEGSPDIGHGGYIIIGNNILFLFENLKTNKSGYVLHEIECTKQDSQTVNFKISEKKGTPLIGVSIYNVEDDSQGTISLIDGIGHITLTKKPQNRIFQLHYMGYEDLKVTFEGNKCYDIDIILKENIEQLNRSIIKAGKLKREGDQLFIKLHTWKEYSKIYLRTS